MRLFYLDVDAEALGKVRVPVTVIRVHEDGSFDYTSELSSGARVRLPLLDAAGAAIAPMAALDIQTKIEAQAAWGKLQAAGLLNDLEDNVKKLTALIDVMRGNTLLKPIITALEARLNG